MKQNTNIVIFILIAFVLINCTQQQKSQVEKEIKDKKIAITDTLKSKKDSLSDIEKIFISAGLIDIHTLDSNIVVELRYSTTNNFVGIDMYGDFNKAYLEKTVAQKLVKAQKYLKDTFPDYNLIIFDAARPLTIQQIMWDSVKMPERLKYKYIANPQIVSMHCYGAAVDLSIVDDSGNELDMGTEFDFFGELAYPCLENKMLKSGKLTTVQLNNRLLLRKIMKKAGFNSITTEWWHFSAYSRQIAQQKFKVIKTHVLPHEDTTLLAEVHIPEIKPINNDSINISFKVQMKTSMKPIDVNDKVFKGLKIYRYYHKGLWKYTTGDFKDLASAYKHRDEMQKLGFSDCFVAGFNNNQRIGIRDAVELAEQ